MKKLLSNKIVTVVTCSLMLLSCNKEAGQGGLASISGNVNGSEYQSGRNEITEVIISDGNDLEHGDYWVLNSTSTDKYYYIWYDNPTWISNGDPGLAGRIGISVEFNYSDSNIDIATNTIDALNAASTEFNLSLLVDIIQISTLAQGPVPDADKMTSPFEINIDQQGKLAVLSPETAIVDEKVYISYGDATNYNDDVNTGANGEFKFSGLRKGDYSLYTFTLDTATNTKVPVYLDAKISDKKQNLDIGSFSIVE